MGLAAPQVGVNVRLMVFNETAQRGDPAETVLVNPEVRAPDALDTTPYICKCMHFRILLLHKQHHTLGLFGWLATAHQSDFVLPAWVQCAEKRCERAVVAGCCCCEAVPMGYWLSRAHALLLHTMCRSSTKAKRLILTRRAASRSQRSMQLWR